MVPLPTAEATRDDAQPAPAVAPRSIARLISRVRAEVMEALDRDLAVHDMSAAQMIVLSTLATGEADSASGLCKGISYDPGAMTRMIDRLEQKGLVRRRPHPEDRRTMNLELTAEGQQLYPKLAAAKDIVLRRFLQGFSDADVATLDRLLTRMLANR
jgi:MarR family transcriptional regulator, multiple antibiotic resistance protein MarR